MKIAAGLLGACLLAAACSGPAPAAPTVTVTAPATRPSADPATLAWVDGFCAAIHGYRKRTNAEAVPNPSEPGSVAEAQKALSEELGGIAARTGEVVDRLTALPQAPVPLAETVRKAFVTKYTTARDRARTAKAALDGAKPDDAASQEPAAQALERAQQDVDGTYDPVAPLADAPELVAAAAAAPGCRA
ncbi:hypothetical protein [Amycolatopsis australiensis]|uniref:Uncharacterized protein n=1 Tax=Amycolatopsis australiensis TaxID=546364 RepID=A0A1K1T564_9PSEU|nr:hypothetical protein [Amycolatopsis australiensis]SFW91654.1 hypothetical protein SAMN04489730_8076 [Amycolatopsis australiensis]